MTNLRQMQIMKKVLEVIVNKIGNYTSRGFAANLVSKAIMDLRSEHESLNYILINETRYEEGLNSFTISEDINEVESNEFFLSIKSLIEKTMQGFDDNIDVHFINELREELPDIFYFIDNADANLDRKYKRKIMIVDNNRETIDSVIKGFYSISDDYEFIDANNTVQCFDLLSSGYKPEVIILSNMMPNEKSRQIFTRLKNNSTWNKIPIIFIKDKDNSEDEFLSELDEDYVSFPFEIKELKNKIDEKLSMKKKA